MTLSLVIVLPRISMRSMVDCWPSLIWNSRSIVPVSVLGMRITLRLPDAALPDVVVTLIYPRAP